MIGLDRPVQDPDVEATNFKLPSRRNPGLIPITPDEVEGSGERQLPPELDFGINPYTEPTVRQRDNICQVPVF